MKNIYTNSDYIAQNYSWHVEDSLWKAGQIQKIINKNNLHEIAFCEVGCGAGEILVQLSKILPKNSTFCGYDISTDLMSFWKERENQNINFFNRDILEINDVYYDILLCMDVVEHIPDYIGFLKNIKEKGKYKIFNIPLEIFALKALFPNKFVGSRMKYGHLHYFNKAIFLATLEDLNYEILDFFYAPGAIDLASVTKSISLFSKLLKIPRILLSTLSKEFTAISIGGYSLMILSK
jgi:hypothetical protein